LFFPTVATIIADKQEKNMRYNDEETKGLPIDIVSLEEFPALKEDMQEFTFCPTIRVMKQEFPIELKMCFKNSWYAGTADNLEAAWDTDKLPETIRTMLAMEPELGKYPQLSNEDKEKVAQAYLISIYKNGYLQEVEKLLKGKLKVTLSKPNPKEGLHSLKLNWKETYKKQDLEQGMSYSFYSFRGRSSKPFHLESRRSASTPQHAAELFVRYVKDRRKEADKRAVDIEKLEGVRGTLKTTLSAPVDVYTSGGRDNAQDKYTLELGEQGEKKEHLRMEFEPQENGFFGMNSAYGQISLSTLKKLTLLMRKELGLTKKEKSELRDDRSM
jgi:hypothetical protein